MATAGDKMKDILLLYDAEDAKDWAEWFYLEFTNMKEKISVVDMQGLQTVAASAANVFPQYSVIVLIVSPNMVQTLASQTTCLAPVLNSHGHISVITLGIKPGEFSAEVLAKYAGSAAWSVFHIQEVDDKLCYQAVSQVCDILQQAKQEKSKAEQSKNVFAKAEHGKLALAIAEQAKRVKDKQAKAEPAKQGQFQHERAKHEEEKVEQAKHRLEQTDEKEKLARPGAKPKAKSGENIVKTVCPNHIRQAGETVVVVLQNALLAESGTLMQVCLDSSDSAKIETKTLSPHCFSFIAPVHKPGKTAVYMFLDGTKIASRTIRYEQFHTPAYTLPDFLCQLLCFEEYDIPRLDLCLSNVFKDSVPQDNSLGYMLTPKNFSNVQAGNKNSPDELPTLLHFACKYNLNTLASSILDVSGAYEALDITNRDDQNPLDIAKDMGNTELVNYIEDLLLMQDYVTDIEDLYEKMSKGQSIQHEYINKDHGYQHMSYVAGRLPESNYEITERQDRPSVRPSVSEVEEHDDITEATGHAVAPGRPPKSLAATSSQSQSNTEPHENMYVMPLQDPMAGAVPLSPASMGSNNLEELYQIIEDYKQGDLTMDDCTKLHRAWAERNRDVMSASIKEKQKRINELKTIYEKVKVEGQSPTKKKGGFFSRFSRNTKKTKLQDINIQHNVQPNSYERMGPQGMQAQPDTPMRHDSQTKQHSQTQGNRDSITSTTSTASNSSAYSTSSLSSQDSGLEAVFEDSLDENPPPARPVRKSSEAKRDSWGTEYLRDRSNSRLPKPPQKTLDLYKPTTPVRNAPPPLGPKPSKH